MILTKSKIYERLIVPVLRFEINSKYAMVDSIQKGYHKLFYFFASSEKDIGSYWGIRNAIINRRLRIIDYYLSRNSIQVHDYMGLSACYNHDDLTHYFICKGANLWKTGLEYAYINKNKRMMWFFSSRLRE